jgi:hypothetical protein
MGLDSHCETTTFACKADALSQPSEIAWQPPALATLVAWIASANIDCLNNLGTLTIPRGIAQL